MLSPVCFCIFLDSLLQAVSELTSPDSYTFADAFKFVTGTSSREHHQRQSVVNFVNCWSGDHRIPLSLNKSDVLHCGNNNTTLLYILDNHSLPVMSQFKYLSILRTKRATYRNRFNIVAALRSKLCGALLHSFRTRQLILLCSAYLAYVKPKLMYAAPVWSPNMK